MRASRLLRLLMLLQTRGRMSARALAEALEVSHRTVHRDIDELTAAGVPVWGDRGRFGGFQLEPGWRTRVDGLTAPEAQALFLGGLPGPAAELGLGEAVASAHLKVLAALPESWREDAQRVGTRFHLDPVDWYRGPVATDHLPAVAAAVWNAQCIDIRYESWNAVVDRRLQPLGLVLKAGVWYLVARVPGQPQARTYRVAAIRAVSPAGVAFERPADFDLAAWWRDSTRRFESSLYRQQAVLRVSERGMALLAQLDAAQVRSALASQGAADAQGWRRLELPIESIGHAAAQLLRLGAEVRVQRPAALRHEILRRIEAIAALYRAA